MNDNDILFPTLEDVSARPAEENEYVTCNPYDSCRPD